VENLIAQKIQGGNFNVNVNQLETAISEVIGPENPINSTYMQNEINQLSPRK
jgi:hypothetical protein